jgi:hypothetical protein
MKITALNLSDASAVRAWLDDLAARVEDVAAVAADQTAPVADRKLGRAAARELLRDAHGTLADLVALARAGLPTDPDATPTELGVTLERDEPPWEGPAERRRLPPAERARKALLFYFNIALPNGAHAGYAAEIVGIVDDIIGATIAKLRVDDHADPAGAGDVGPAASE